VVGGLRVAGWTVLSAGGALALVVGAKAGLDLAPDQERCAMEVVTLAAARPSSADQAPSPGTLAYSHTLNQERDRVRLELRTRHAATLSELLQTLRRGADAGGLRATPPAVSEAINLASQALLDLRAEAERNQAAASIVVLEAFAEAEAEVRRILRANRLQLVAGLDVGGEERLPQAIAQTARIVTRAAALHAGAQTGADKVRLQWRLIDDALLVTVADNGPGMASADERRMLAEVRRSVIGLGGCLDVEVTPQWGTTLSCRLPLQSLPVAPETPALLKVSQLREREREVLELMVAGLPNRDIANRLVITVRTVKFHVSNILRKLEVRSRTEAIALAHSAGVSAPEPA
jgi:DNA-binding CsgD family transcriptional regulator